MDYQRRGERGCLRFVPIVIGIILFFVIGMQIASAQPTPIDSLDDNWEQENQITIWVIPNTTDTAKVANIDAGNFWQVFYQERGFARCPQVPFFNTSDLLKPYDENISGKIECVNDVRTVIDTLTSFNIQGPDRFVFQDECVTSVDNATIHFPDPSGINASVGDTVATYNESGNCTGYGIVQESGATMAAARKNEFVPTGHEDGSQMRVQVASESGTQNFVPKFGDCSEVPICRETNSFEKGAWYSIISQNESL